MTDPRAFPDKQALLRKWGANVRARRIALDLSQDKLTEISGVPQSTLSRVERGELEPSLDMSLRICIGLGAEPGDLFPWPPLRASVTA